MQLAERLKRYTDIEDHRGRPLIVYATTTRQGVSGQMAGDTVREFVDQIDVITEGDSVDVLIHSTGGDALAAWKFMSVLRERFDRVSVLVPYMAFSAATIFTLGADEIVMHPHASLGPIDPQIGVKQKDGTTRRFSFEDVGAFLRFLEDEVGITEQAYLSSIADKLFSVVDPVIVGGAKRASELASSVGERLLLMHMTKAEEQIRAHQIAENLNKSFFSHGDAVSRSRARELELKIAKDDTQLEKLIWRAYLGLEEYMELRKPFVPLQHFLSDDEAAQSLKPKAPLELPPNAPSELVQQLWNRVSQQALSNLSRPAIEVRYSVVNAVVESVRLASEYRTSGTMTAARVAGGEIKLFFADDDTGWRCVELPVPGDVSTDANDVESDGEVKAN